MKRSAKAGQPLEGSAASGDGSCPMRRSKTASGAPETGAFVALDDASTGTDAIYASTQARAPPGSTPPSSATRTSRRPRFTFEAGSREGHADQVIHRIAEQERNCGAKPNRKNRRNPRVDWLPDQGSNLGPAD